jgi:primosomal protein N' (replication factor Y)
VSEPERVVRVLPDVVGIDKAFDYLVPDGVEVHLGDVVRIDLNGRRVGGWIVILHPDPEPGVVLRRLAKVSGRGPSAELLDLAEWAAWRWAGRRTHLLRTATPPGVVRSLVSLAPPAPAAGPSSAGIQIVDPSLARALTLDRGVLRWPPGADRYALVRAAAGSDGHGPGQMLVLCPSVDEAWALGRRLRRDGVATAVITGDRGSGATGEWIHAASGRARVVVGSRSAAWAPAPDLTRVVVLDEHDEAYQQEAAPTWHARDVVMERAERAGVACLLVSPCPTLEALAWGELVTVDRSRERAGWSRLEVVDQRDLDPALGPLFSPRLVDLVRSDGRVLCVLNRTGRARLLACVACTTLARCEVCDAAVSLVDASGGVGDELVCGRCDTRRPVVCLACGAHGFKQAALAGETVGEVTASTAPDDPVLTEVRLLVGTEALLHRVARADSVAFLDYDQELLSLRYRAAEQALGLLARAARLVRRGGTDRGRVLVQTRSPDHPALMAARHADPDRLVRSELPLRVTLGLPPSVALAVVSGQVAPELMGAFGTPGGVSIQGPVDGAWRLRAADHRVLCDALAATARPPGRVRIEVDPLRI